MEQPRVLRPLGLMEIVDQIFRLYRANFWLLCGIAAVFYIPFGLLYGIPTIGPFIAAGVALIMSPMCMGAMVVAVSQRYLGHPITVGESYRRIVRAPSVFVTILIVYLLWLALLLIPALPFLALLIPTLRNPESVGLIAVTVVVGLVCALVMLVLALVMSAWWPFCIIAHVLEGQRYFQAVRRATYLLRPWVWAQVVLVGFIIGIITSVIQNALTLPFLLPMWISNPEAMMTGDAAPFFLVVGLATALSGSVTFPLSTGVYVLIYYDCRVRKEGYDLTLLARELAASVPPREPQPVSLSLPEGQGSQPPEAGGTPPEVPPPDA